MRRVLMLAGGPLVMLVATVAHAGPVAAIEPAGRSIQVGQTATTYAVVINTDTVTATGCLVRPDVRIPTVIPVTFLYQATDPVTNQLIGSPNTPVDIPPGGMQTFLLAFTALSQFPPVEMNLTFSCSTGSPGRGLTTFELTASTVPTPDIIAVPTSYDVTLPPGGEYVGIAMTNVGAAEIGFISVDSGDVELPVLLCTFSHRNGPCLALPASPHVGFSSTFDFPQGPFPYSLTLFFIPIGPIPFDPETNRIFVRFSSGGVRRGIASFAIRTLD